MTRLHPTLIRKRTTLLLLLLNSLLGLVPSSLGATFVVRVQPNEEECFMIRTGSYDPGRPRFLEGGFEVIDDYSTESILVMLMDEKEHAVYQRTNERHDYFFVENVAPNTHYWLCLQSHPPPDATDEGSKSERIIGFEFELVFDEDDYPTLPPQPGPIQVEPYTTRWMHKANALHHNLKNLQSHHSYMHVRELEHRKVTEKTFSDILFWTLLEVTLVLLLAFGQVMYFRTYLEKKQASRW